VKLEKYVGEDGLPFVIIRTYSAGVHIGFLKSSEDTLAGMKVTLVNSRRIYSWAGALTLSDLAVIGTYNPDECKITLEVPEIVLIAVEIISVTPEGYRSLNSVKVWQL